MRKFFSLIAAVLFAGSMMASVVTLDPSTQTDAPASSNAGDPIELTINGITIAYQGAVNASTAPADFRVYGNQNLTLSATSNISKVTIAGKANKAGWAPTVSAGEITTGASYEGITTKATLEDPLFVVENINAQSISITCNKQLRAYMIEVTLAEGGEVPPTPAVATPVISGDETFTESVIVTITCSTPEADIYYTTDGTTDPKCDCSAAPEYTQQIVLTETTTIMAAAYTGNDWSAVATKTFTKVEPLADPTNCAEAAAAALSVSANNELYNNGAVYTIEGYVTSIQTAYSDPYHNITFWMADAADGGNVLEAYRAACETEADAPKVGDKVAVTGSLTKYGTTPEFAAACTFVITERAPQPTVNYYVCGSMTSWAANEAYILTPNNENLYQGEFTFAANDEFKVIGFDGENTTWFPEGMGNNFQITEAGDYQITFNPAGNVDGWYAGFFNVVKKEALPDPTNCAEAAEAALSVSANNELYNNGAVYTIEGYVTGIKTAYSDQYHNISFWMADAADGGEVLQAYRAACASEADAPQVGDKVAVTGSLTKYGSTPEFAAGCTYEIIKTPIEPLIIPTEAPVPTAEEADVMAIFCNHYTTNNANFGISGWAGGYQILDLNGINVGYWTGMTWECIIDPAHTDDPHDFSAYKNIHVDLWAPLPAKIKLTAEAVAGGNYKDGQVVEMQQGWNSVDFVVADWAGNYDFKNLKCFVFEQYQTLAGESFEGNPFAFANIYFYGKEEQGINNTDATVKAVKAIVNGNLIIEKNGVRYNVMGQIVK